MTVTSAAQARPVILIPPTHVPADEDIRLAQNYADAVIRAGGAPVILPLTADASVYETLFDLADGVLLTGGHDVDPALYGHTVPSAAGEKKAGPDGADPDAAAPSKSAQRLGASGDITPLRDAVEYALLDYAFAHSLPIYGICRGIQILNVYLGGTLWYDLPAHYEPTWPAWAQALAGQDGARGRRAPTSPARFSPTTCTSPTATTTATPTRMTRCWPPARTWRSSSAARGCP